MESLASFWWLSYIPFNIPFKKCTSFPLVFPWTFWFLPCLGSWKRWHRFVYMCLLQQQSDLDVALVWDRWVIGYLHLQGFKDPPGCAPQCLQWLLFSVLLAEGSLFWISLTVCSPLDGGHRDVWGWYAVNFIFIFLIACDMRLFVYVVFCILKSVYTIYLLKLMTGKLAWLQICMKSPTPRLFLEGRSPLRAAGPCESEAHLNTSLAAAVTWTATRQQHLYVPLWFWGQKADWKLFFWGCKWAWNVPEQTPVGLSRYFFPIFHHSSTLDKSQAALHLSHAWAAVICR